MPRSKKTANVKTSAAPINLARRTNRIFEFRQVVEKVVHLLVERQINVTQVGTQAKVEYDVETGAIRRLNIPYIPDDATEEYLGAIQGFVDHEVAHVLFTDTQESTVAKKWHAARASVSEKDKQGEHNMFNMLEDTRIERLMRRRFSGTTSHLEDTTRFVLEHRQKPAVQAALEAGDNQMLAQMLFMPIIRSCAGQRVATEFLDDLGPLPAPVQTLREELEKFGSQIAKLETTAETTALAGDMFRRFKPAAKPPSPTGEDKGDGEKSDEQEDGEGDGSGSSSSPEKDEGQDDDQTGDGDQSADESKPDDEKDGGDGENGGDNESDAPSEDELGDEDGQPQEDEDHGNPDGADDQGEDNSESEGEGAAEDERPEDSNELDPGETGSTSGDERDEQAINEKESDNKAGSDAAAGGSQETDGGDEEPESETEVEEMSPDVAELGQGAINEAEDSQASAAELINNLASGAATNADYLIYTEDYDTFRRVTIEDDKRPIVERELRKAEEQLNGMVGVLQTQIRRLFAQQSQSILYGGQRSGRLQGSALHRILAGDDRVFSRKEVHQATDTAVTLLVDCSGSMHHDSKIRIATRGALALSQTLERVGIVHEILGFTTEHDNHDDSIYTDAATEAARIGRAFSRITPIRTYVFKEFGERLSHDVRLNLIAAGGEDNGSRYGHDLPPQINMCANIDGDSILIAARRLVRQRQKRKVMIVLSDGCPAGSWYDHAEDIVKHTGDAVEACEALGVETIGIGIADESVKNFYSKVAVINDVTELPKAIMTELQRALLSKRAA